MTAAQQHRKILCEMIQRAIGSKLDVELALSGGTDSTAILFTLLDLGIRPTCYTYYIKGMESDAVVRSKKLTSHYGLELKMVEVPTDPHPNLEALLHMLQQGIRSKVGIQVHHGHVFLARQASRIIVGSGPDTLCGTYRHYAFSGARDDKEKFDSMRLARFDRDEGFAATQRLYASLGSEAIIPLCSTEYVSFMMQFSWRELNAGRIKSIFKDAFPAQYGALGLTRTCLRKAQQLEAGTLNLYEQFLPGSVLDRNKTGNVRRILNDLFRASTMELNVLQAQVGYTNYE